MTLFQTTASTEQPDDLGSHARFLADAFIKLLGQPSDGAMAFVRCLPRDIVLALCRNRVFAVPGWEVYGVAGERDDANRLITADWAVELREDKRGRVLLVV